MNLERLHNMLNTKEKIDVYYNERPVWIQEIHDDIAKVSFIDNFEEKDVYIEDLYENDLYNWEYGASLKDAPYPFYPTCTIKVDFS